MAKYNWFVTICLLLLLLLCEECTAACCNDAQCGKTLECGVNSTFMRVDLANCACCDRCAHSINQSCIPASADDFCEAGLTCYPVDEHAEIGKCEPDNKFDFAESGTDRELLDGTEEPDSTDHELLDGADRDPNLCDIEECEEIFRCPVNSKLILDQHSATDDGFLLINNSNSAYADDKDGVVSCCKRRFGTKCRCDYRQCATVVDAAVTHCLNNQEFTTGEHDGCCAKFERCVEQASPKTKVTNLPPTLKTNIPTYNKSCSSWLDTSNSVIILTNQSQSTVDLCGGSTRLPKCTGSWFELSLQSSECCAELQCAKQREIVCEQSRCPQEQDLHFTAVLLTNLEACACVRIDNSSQTARLEVCPQRLCTAHPTKCYQHSHVLDEAGCPICRSTEVACNVSFASIEDSKICDDAKTGRHSSGERWYSDSCGSCYCSSDGIAKCEIRDCSQTPNREWVSANIAMVLASAALTISTIVLIYIVVRKLRNRKWKRHAAALEKSQRSADPHGDYREINWGFLNVPRTNAAGYAMVERHRRTPGGAIWQRTTDVPPGELVYVTLNGNSEFQTGFTSPQTATTAMDCGRSGTMSTVV